jgi:hypothetical protein
MYLDISVFQNIRPSIRKVIIMLTYPALNKLMLTLLFFSLLNVQLACGASPVVDTNIKDKAIKTLKNDWVTSKDKALSYRIIPEFDEVDKDHDMYFIAELRNNTAYDMYVFLPFGDLYQIGVEIEGSNGRIRYTGINIDFIGGRYANIESGGVLLERMILSSLSFKGILSPGEYKIKYTYQGQGGKFDKYGKESWAGEIESNTIIIKRK